MVYRASSRTAGMLYGDTLSQKNKNKKVESDKDTKHLPKASLCMHIHTHEHTDMHCTNIEYAFICHGLGKRPKYIKTKLTDPGYC